MEAVDPVAVAALIEPWLGGAPPQALPLPRFYDVLLQPGREALTPALLAEFAALAPDARLERYDAWNAPLLRSAGRLRALSLAGLALAAAAFALAAFHAARGALLAHRETVRLVHRLGATDGFLAREVARGARRLGFQGALWGALLAAPLLAAAFAALPRADSLQDGSLQTLPLQAGLPWQLWLALFAAPSLRCRSACGCGCATSACASSCGAKPEAARRFRCVRRLRSVRRARQAPRLRLGHTLALPRRCLAPQLVLALPPPRRRAGRSGPARVGLAAPGRCGGRPHRRAPSGCRRG